MLTRGGVRPVEAPSDLAVVVQQDLLAHDDGIGLNVGHENSWVRERFLNQGSQAAGGTAWLYCYALRVDLRSSSLKATPLLVVRLRLDAPAAEA